MEKYKDIYHHLLLIKQLENRLLKSLKKPNLDDFYLYVIDNEIYSKINKYVTISDDLARNIIQLTMDVLKLPLKDIILNVNNNPLTMEKVNDTNDLIEFVKQNIKPLNFYSWDILIQRQPWYLDITLARQNFKKIINSYIHELRLMLSYLSFLPF